VGWRVFLVAPVVAISLGSQSPAYFHAATAAVTARIPGATIIASHGQEHRAIDYDPQQFIRVAREFDSSALSFLRK
jgi:hypothetical protein